MTGEFMSIESFDDWLRHVFEQVPDHDTPIQIGNLTLAEYLARLFGSPRIVMERYTKTQVANGIWYMGSIRTEWYRNARAQNVPVELQVQWVRSISNLYHELFAVWCENRFDSSGDLETAAIMFWDMDCLEGAAMCPEEQHSAHLVDPIFDVLTDALSIDHLVCQQSALHGLGHLYHWNEARVPPIIDRFLNSHPDLPFDLADYARMARVGAVE